MRTCRRPVLATLCRGLFRKFQLFVVLASAISAIPLTNLPRSLLPRLIAVNFIRLFAIPSLSFAELRLRTGGLGGRKPSHQQLHKESENFSAYPLLLC